MSKTRNIIQWGAGALLGLAIAAVSFRVGYAFGGGDAEAMRELREHGEYQSEQIANAQAIFKQEHEARVALQKRLGAIERALAEARTIHVERGADGVLSASVIRTDKSGYEVQGRMLEELLGDGQ